MYNDQREVVRQPVCQLSPQWALTTLPLFLNLWATSHRLQDVTRDPCIFGCEGQAGAFEHYLVYLPLRLVIGLHDDRTTRRRAFRRRTGRARRSATIQPEGRVRRGRRYDVALLRRWSTTLCAHTATSMGCGPRNLRSPQRVRLCGSTSWRSRPSGVERRRLAQRLAVVTAFPHTCALRRAPAFRLCPARVDRGLQRGGARPKRRCGSRAERRRHGRTSCAAVRSTCS